MSQDSGGLLPLRNGKQQDGEGTPDGENKGYESFDNPYNLDLKLEWSIPIEHEGKELVSVYLDRWSEEAKDSMLHSRAEYHWKQRRLRDAVRNLREYVHGKKTNWRRKIVATAHYRQKTLASGFKKWRDVHVNELHPITASSKLTKLASRRFKLLHALNAKWNVWITGQKLKREESKKARRIVSKPALQKAVIEWRNFTIFSRQLRNASEEVTKRRNVGLLKIHYSIWLERRKTQKLFHNLQRKVSKRVDADALRHAFYVWRFNWLEYKRKLDVMAKEFFLNSLSQKPMIVGQFLLRGHSTDERILTKVVFSAWKSQALYQRRIADGLDIMTASVEKATQRIALTKWGLFTRELVDQELALDFFRKRSLLVAINRWKIGLMSSLKKVWPNVGNMPHSMNASTGGENKVERQVNLRGELLALSHKRRSHALRHIRISKAINAWKRYVERGYLKYSSNSIQKSTGTSTDKAKEEYLASIHAFVSEKSGKMGTNNSEPKKLKRHFPVDVTALPPRARRRALLRRIANISRVLIDERGLLASCFEHWRKATVEKQTLKEKIELFLKKRQLNLCRVILNAWHNAWENHSMKEFQLMKSLRQSLILQSFSEEERKGGASAKNIKPESTLVKNLIRFNRMRRTSATRQVLNVWFASAMRLRSIRTAGAALSISHRANEKREAFEIWRMAFKSTIEQKKLLQLKAEVAQEEMQRNWMKKSIGKWKFITQTLKLLSKRKCISENLRKASIHFDQCRIRECVNIWKEKARTGVLTKTKTNFIYRKNADSFRTKRLFKSAISVWLGVYDVRCKKRALEGTALRHWATKLKRDAFGCWLFALEKQRGSIAEAVKERTLVDIASRLRKARRLSVATVALLDVCNLSREVKNDALYAGVSKEEILLRARDQMLNEGNVSRSESLSVLLREALNSSPNSSRKHLHVKKPIKLEFPPIEGSSDIIHSICSTIPLPVPNNLPVGAELMKLQRASRRRFFVRRGPNDRECNFEFFLVSEGMQPGKDDCLVNLSSWEMRAASHSCFTPNNGDKKKDLSRILTFSDNVRLPPRVPYALLYPPKTIGGKAKYAHSLGDEMSKQTGAEEKRVVKAIPANLQLLLNELEVRKQLRANNQPLKNDTDVQYNNFCEYLNSADSDRPKTEAATTTAHRPQPRRPEYIWLGLENNETNV